MADGSYYNDLPERERNLDPKSRSLGVMSNFLGLLPYARAGVEATARGESFRGGTPQNERQRRALQQYYADAYESAPDSVKVLSVIGLPFGAVSSASNALAPIGRPVAVAAGTMGAMGATGDISRPKNRTPAMQWRERPVRYWVPVSACSWAEQAQKRRNIQTPCSIIYQAGDIPPETL
jgi:hypothetical protein